MWGCAKALAANIIFLVLVGSHCFPFHFPLQGQNPCNVNDTTQVEAANPLNEEAFKNIVYNVIGDLSSGITVHCSGIYTQSVKLSSDIKSFLLKNSGAWVLQQRKVVYPEISCNQTQIMSRQEVVACLISSVELLKNISLSIDVIRETDFSSKRHMQSYLAALYDIGASIDRALCSMFTNGLSRLVDYNSLDIGPFDVTGGLNSQIDAYHTIYYLSKMLETICKRDNMPETLTMLLHIKSPTEVIG